MDPQSQGLEEYQCQLSLVVSQVMSHDQEVVPNQFVLNSEDQSIANEYGQYDVEKFSCRVVRLRMSSSQELW